MKAELDEHRPAVIDTAELTVDAADTAAPETAEVEELLVEEVSDRRNVRRLLESRWL